MIRMYIHTEINVIIAHLNRGCTQNQHVIFPNKVIFFLAYAVYIWTISPIRCLYLDDFSHTLPIFGRLDFYKNPPIYSHKHTSPRKEMEENKESNQVNLLISEMCRLVKSGQIVPVEITKTGETNSKNGVKLEMYNFEFIIKKT